MLFVMLALILHQQDEEIRTPQDAHRAVIRQLDELDEQTSSMLRSFTTGHIDEEKRPDLGLLIHSDDEPGQDGLHAVTVIAMYGVGPAAKAGVRLGDRIVMIGPRRIEHETNEVLYELMRGKTDAVALTLSRGDEKLEVTVRPEVPTCSYTALQEAAKPRLVAVRAIQDASTELRATMAKHPNDLATASAVAEKINELLEIINDLYEIVKEALFAQAVKHCDLRFQ